MKKALAALLAIAMVVTGFLCLYPNASEANAATTTTDHGTYIAVPRAEWKDENKDGIPEKDGYLFAGFYKSAECTKANRTSKGGAYAKFVSGDMLDVKAQVTNGVVQKSDVVDADGNNMYENKYVIRFISSVESLNYKNIGFELEYTNDEGEVVKLRNTTSKVFKRIDSTTGATLETIDTYEFSPKVVGEDSEYFMTAKLPVDVEDKAVTYKVRAFWTTFDGTEVMGKTRCVSVNDGDNDVVNVTVQADKQLTVGTDYTATYGPNVEGTGTDAIKVKVLSSDADGHSNIRVTLATGDTATGLKSATKIIIKDAEGNQVATAVYRNYYTDKAGTADTSWYDVEPTATRFDIASVSDLYGLASIVNGKKDLFYQDEIHLVRSVEVNEGLAIRASETTDGVAKWTGEKVAWTPIGQGWNADFRGIFDGDNNTISGLYMENANTFTGLFGYVGVNNAQSATIKNFRLTNSYFKTDKQHLGSIVAYGYELGRLENVYSNAVLVTTYTHTNTTFYGAGGLVGHLNFGTSAYTYSEDMEPTTIITNCWFDGEISAKDAKNIDVGGILGGSGSSKAYLLIENCLNTGTVVGSSTNGYVGGILGRNVNPVWLMKVKNCLDTGNVKSEKAGLGGLFGANNGATNNYALENCYTVQSEAWYSNEGSYVESNFTKNKAELAATDVNTLFPGSNGAWVNDVEDAQTPILSSFASWWKEEQYKAGLDTSWYVADEKEYVITTVAQLNGLANLVNEGNSFAGKTIKLGADIALNKVDSTILKKWVKGTAIADNMWTPIGTSDSKFAGTFDGQGYTISGLYLKSTAVGAGLFGYTADTAVFKNFKFVDSYITSTRDEVGMIGNGSFELIENVYTNAVIKTSGQKAGGFVGVIVPRGTVQNTQYNIAFKNCWFDGEVETASANAGGFVGVESAAAGILFENCLSTGAIKSSFRSGGFYGWKNAYAWHEFHNCLSVAKTIVTNTSDYATYWGSYYGDHNTSTYNMKVYNSYGLNKIAGKGADAFETATYVKTRDELLHADETTLFPVLSGETDNAWVSGSTQGWNDTDRGTPILATFAEWWIANVEHDEITVDISWYNDNDTEFTLYDAADLNGLAYVANNKDDFTGRTIKLGDDIQFNKVNAEILASWQGGTVVPKHTWTPIGTDAKRFNGTFDGQGHEISGLYLSATTEGAGLFGYTGVDSQFKNFKFVDSYMTSISNCLGMIGVGRFVNIENIYTNVTIKGSGNLIGGFVGVMYNIKGDYAALYSNIKNCWFDGTITQTDGSKYGMGGFIGGTGAAAALGFHNCLSTGTVTGGFRVGGFYGWKNYYATLEAHNCLSVANVSTNVAKNYEEFEELVGSYFGDYSSNAYNVNFYNSYGLSGNRINGGTTASYATKLETDTYIKARTYLINTDETTLFPVLSGEAENAWVNDIGYNATDRGTPMLASFAEWWLNRQAETELLDKADTSWYNDNDTEFVLTTQGQLYGFAKLGQTNTFAGKTIKLGADIELNKVDAATVEAWKNGTVPAGQWTPVVGFAGTFDGQGHTISGLYLNATTASAGMFGTTTATAVIKNFQLVDSYMKSTAKGLGIVGTGTFASMENIYTSAVMVSTSTDVAGFAGTVATNGGTVVFENCWFDGEIIHTGDMLVGGFVGEDAGATVITFSNCLSTGKITGTAKVGGFMGWANNYAVKTFNNCLSIAEVEATGSTTYAGAYFGQLNTSPYNFTVTNTYGVGARFCGVYRAADTAYETKYESATYLKNRDELCGADVATLFAGSTAWANDNEDGYNDTDRGTPILATFADFWKARQPEPVYTVDKSWYNTTDNEFTLYDLADIRGFMAIANSQDDFTGKTVKLGADIVVNTPNVDAWIAKTATPSFEWTPIGTSAKPFNGTFDGQGYTISGLYLNATTVGAGLFGYTGTDSEFKNFKFIDSYIVSSADIVGMIGTGSFKLMENVYTNATIETSTTRAAGFVGEITPRGDAQNTQANIVFNNCWFDGDVTTGSSSAGGFIGTASAATGILFKNCLSTGNVQASLRAGGFFGWKNNYAYNEFRNCLSVASVTVTNTADYATYWGAFYGDHNTSTYNTKLYNTYGVDKFVGHYSETTNPFETATYVKTRDEIIDTDEKFLFPVLSGETENAWVNDIGYNDTHRGTPMLASFAEWWMEQYPAEGLQSRPDISWYDAEETEFTITTADQLRGFAQLAKVTTFEGQTVKLGANIALNEVDETILGKWQEGSAVGRQWTPIGTASSKFTGTFDGQGYEISGLYHKSTGANVGLFGTVAHGSVIRNFKLIDSYIYGNGNVGIVGTGLASTIEKIYTNAIIESTANNAGGIIGASVGHYTDKTVGGNENWAQGIMVINECWFDGQINMLGSAYSGGGILGAPGQRSRIDFNNCLYTGTITSERTDVYTRLGGFIGWENSSAKYNFTNCLSVGNYEATNTSYVGGFIGNIGGDGASFTNCYTSYPSANASRVGIGTGTNDITYTNTSEQTRADLRLADLATLFAGSTAWAHDAGYNAIDRGTPILATFAEWWIARRGEDEFEEVPSIAWYTSPEKEDEYVIQNKGDLLGFLSLATKEGETFEGKTIKLGANITLNTPNVDKWAAGEAAPTYKWSPITFKGNFDGQGHSISGVYVKSGATYVGFFGQTAAGSTISNFRLLDSYIEQTAGKWSRFTGAIVGECSGNIDNVYSNVTIVSACNYVGGIVGHVQASKGTNGELTISNCWYDGEIRLKDDIGYTGGIAGYQPNGKLYLTNVMSTGHIKGNHTGNAYIGGILGGTAQAVSGTELESVVAVGTFDIQTGTKMIGAVVGYFYSGTSADVTANYKFNNVFANRGWGTPYSWGGGNGTLTGKVIQTSTGDRLLGYVPQSITGASTEQKLDFTTNKTWTMRTNDVPVLTVFKDIVDVRTLVSADDLTATNLTSALGLNAISGNFSNAVADGAGDYVVTVSGSKTTYDNYLSQLTSLGFTKFVDNAGTTMATDGIYSATYVKGSNSALNVAQWVVNVTYVNNDGKLYVSINSDVDSVANTLLNDDEKNPLGKESGTNAISLSMLEDIAGVSVTGNCFVFQLPNGHFIINDGNTNGGSGAILKAYLQELAGEGNPIYVDAWVISHFHNDHGGALMDMASDASLRENIYVDALYVNEASMYAQTTYTEGGNAYTHTNTILDGARKLQRSKTNSESPVVYQVHMGQRYYLNGITLDIVNTPEQLVYVDWKGGDGTEQVPDTFNTSSVNIVYTIQNGGKRILIGGDSTQVTMKYIMKAYGKNGSGYGTSKTLSNINVFSAYHHGKNAINNYDPTHTTVDGVRRVHIAATADNSWGDYLLKNTNNASGFKFDAMLFPNYKKYECHLDPSTACDNLSGCAGRYIGDDAATVYPYNIGVINQYYADNASLNFTTGYQDMTSATDANRHGTVKITFNSNGIISWTAYNSVHGQETYTFTEFSSGSKGTATEDTEL